MLMFGGFFPVGIWGLSLGVMGFFECIRLLFEERGRVLTVDCSDQSGGKRGLVRSSLNLLCR